MPRGARKSQSGAARTRRTQLPLVEELPALLDERELSLRALAGEVGVNQSHLSRVLAPGSGRIVSGALAGRIALALDLPEDYFPEFRASVAHEAIDTDAAIREATYRRVKRS